MALVPLATLDDLEERLGRPLGDDAVRAAALLQDASAAVRAYTGQQFTAGTSTTRLRIRDGVVKLPQQPVTAVASVRSITGSGVLFQWVGDQQVDLWSIPVANLSPRWLRSQLYVDVTYSHGNDDVPDDVVGVVCQMAGRAFGVPPDESGLTQEDIGTYRYRTGGAAASGALGMLAAERAVLDRHRLPSRSVYSW